MDRRTRWIVIGLVVAILAVLLVGWRVLRRPPRRDPATAARQARQRSAAQRRRLAAQQAALRDRLRRLHANHPGARMIVGRVSSSDGAAIASAEILVVLPGGRPLVARSGADGRYGLVGVPADAERMEVSARGYQPRTFAPLKLPNVLRVRWDVTLEAAAGVHGVVLLGIEPVAGALVRLLRQGGRRARGSVRTGPSGRFSLPLDTAGSFVVLAWHHEYGQARQTVSGPGEVTLRLPGGGYVEGRVVDREGRPVTRFSLSSSALARAGRAGPTRSFASADGRFRLGPVAAMLQRLYAFAPGYQPSRSRALSVRSGQTLRDVVITLGASGELYGQVTDASTGQPVRGANVAPAEWGSRALGAAAGTVSDAGGHYTLRSVPDARTSLRVRAEGFEPLLAGGVECAAGQRCKRDFALTPVPPGTRPGGQLTGVGAVLRKTGEGVLIQQLLPGGPAQAVLQPGDLVIQVGDLDARGVGLREVAQAIRGEAGTEVVLWVRRAGQSEPQRVVLTRAVVTMPARRR